MKKTIQIQYDFNAIRISVNREYLENEPTPITLKQDMIMAEFKYTAEKGLRVKYDEKYEEKLNSLNN